VLKTFSKEEKRSKTVPRSRIVVNWDSCNCCVLVEFSLISLFRKGFFSAVSGLSLSLLSECDLPCLVFLLSSVMQTTTKRRSLDCSKTVLELLVSKKIKSRSRRIRRDRDLWEMSIGLKFARPTFSEDRGLNRRK